MRGKVDALIALGDTYLELAQTEVGEERALRSYKSALVLAYKAELQKKQHRGRSTAKDLVRARLAVAYCSRKGGDKSTNLRAVLVYSDSLALDEKRDVELLARAKISRAMAYRDRDSSEGIPWMDGLLAVNTLEAVIVSLEKTGKRNVIWAEAQVELGKTLLWLTPDPDNRRRSAIAHLRKGLAVLSPESHSVLFARAHACLAEYHLQFRSKNLSEKKANRIREYNRAALDSLARAGEWREWSALNVSLCDQLSRYNHEENWRERAVDHLGEALVRLTGETDLPLRQEVLHRLGRSWYWRGLWERASLFLGQALACTWALLDRSGDLGSRRASVRDVSSLTTALAYCHIKTSNLDGALQILEAGKAVLLRAALEMRAFEAAPLDPAERQQLSRLLRRIRKLEAEEYSGMHYIEHSELLAQLRARLRTVVAKLRQNHLELRSPDVSIEQIAPRVAGAAVVVPLITVHGGALIIICPGDRAIAKENVILLDELTSERVGKWLVTGSAVSHSWFESYRNRKNGVVEWEVWRRGVSAMGEALGEVIAMTLSRRLNDLRIGSITIIPSGGLQVLPLHAATWSENGRKFTFGDEFSVSYAPSLYALAGGQFEQINWAAALVAGVSEYNELDPIPHVRSEIRMVSAILQRPALLDAGVTREGLLRELPRASMAHIACHAIDWALAGNSFHMSLISEPVLRLWQEGLTFQDLLKLDLRNTYLVTLSACDTGMVDTRFEWDQFEGIVHVLMQAGVRAVVSSLWSVDDRSSSFLMQRFYRNLIEQRMKLAGALMEAQKWLRTSTRSDFAKVYVNFMKTDPEAYADDYSELVLGGNPEDRLYADPVYWAPFILTGQGDNR